MLFRALFAGARSLLLHPMRSMLTVLGIFIGVASVIWLLAIGEGISSKAQEQIASLGAENIIIRSIKPPDDALGVSSSGAVPYGLTREDYARLVNLKGVKYALRIREYRYKFHSHQFSLDGRVVGCTPEYAQVTQLHMEKGNFLSAADMLPPHKNVCVLAAETARILFPLEDPLGKNIFIERDVYKVIGILKPRQATAGIGGSFAGQDFSKDVYIPIETFWDRIGVAISRRTASSRESEYLELSQITLCAESVEDVPDLANVVERLLKDKHKMADYAVTVPLELLEQAKNTRIMFIFLLGFIAAISLVVGGIGIMNIMLATVTERTREIGIRRALGAKRRDITRQFLIETTLLSAIGGLTGIVGGLLCQPITEIARTFMETHYAEMMADLPELVRSVKPIIVSWSIPLAFGISVFVGVVFGLYPATRAAKMDPIEALRYQ